MHIYICMYICTFLILSTKSSKWSSGAQGNRVISATGHTRIESSHSLTPTGKNRNYEHQKSKKNRATAHFLSWLGISLQLSQIVLGRDNGFPALTERSFPHHPALVFPIPPTALSGFAEMVAKSVCKCSSSQGYKRVLMKLVHQTRTEQKEYGDMFVNQESKTSF